MPFPPVYSGGSNDSGSSPDPAIISKATAARVEILSDPRFGDGLSYGDQGDTVIRNQGGLRQLFRRVGPGLNDWELISAPSIQNARSAGEVQDILRACLINASYAPELLDPEDFPTANLLPTAARIVKPTSTDPVADIDEPIIDIVGGVNLFTSGGHARYVHLDGFGHRVAARTQQGIGGWDAEDAGSEDIDGEESFCRITCLKLLEAPGDGSQWIFSCGDDGEDVGTHALGFNSSVQVPFPFAPPGMGENDGQHGVPAGTPFVYFKDAEGEVITFANVDAGTWLDGGVHLAVWGIFRGDHIEDDPYATIVTDTNGWLNGYADTPAFPVFGSMSNPGGIVGWRDGRFGVAGAAVHGFFDIFLRGEAAEWALYNATAICDSRSGLLQV